MFVSKAIAKIGIGWLGWFNLFRGNVTISLTVDQMFKNILFDLEFLPLLLFLFVITLFLVLLDCVIDLASDLLTIEIRVHNYY